MPAGTERGPQLVSAATVPAGKDGQSHYGAVHPESGLFFEHLRTGAVRPGTLRRSEPANVERDQGLVWVEKGNERDPFWRVAAANLPAHFMNRREDRRSIASVLRRPDDDLLDLAVHTGWDAHKGRCGRLDDLVVARGIPVIARL